MVSYRTVQRWTTKKQRRVAMAAMASPLAKHEQLARQLGMSRRSVSYILQRLNARLRAKGLLPIGTRLAA
jgi:DNA-binding CsgD family transcriptional regulator